MTSSAFILRPGEGRPIDLGNFQMVVKADMPDAAGAFTLIESDEPADFGPPLHIHHDAAEAFYVLAGEYTFFVAGDSFACPAGSFIYIPPGVVHGFKTGPQPSRKLNFYAPAAMIGYFDELSAAIASGQMDDETLSEIANRYGMEVVGPVPEGYV